MVDTHRESGSTDLDTIKHIPLFCPRYDVAKQQSAIAGFQSEREAGLCLIRVIARRTETHTPDQHRVSLQIAVETLQQSNTKQPISDGDGDEGSYGVGKTMVGG